MKRNPHNLPTHDLTFDPYKSATVQAGGRVGAIQLKVGRKLPGGDSRTPAEAKQSGKKVTRVATVAATALIAAGAISQAPSAVENVVRGADNVAAQFDDPPTKLTQSQMEQKAADEKAAEASAVATGTSDNPAAMVGPGSAVDLVSAEGNRIAEVSTPTPIEIPKQP